MQRYVLGVLLGCAMISGCASRTAGTGEATPAAAAAKFPPPPANSPLAQVKPGMHAADVSKLLGEPSGRAHYETGKRWIPGYMGNDMSRDAWLYKGMGRVVFTGGGPFGGAGDVVQVEYDPTETGMSR